MTLLLAASLLLRAGAVGAVTLPYSVAVSATQVYSDVGTLLVVSTNASWFRASPTALCSINSLDTPFNSADMGKYKSLKALNATVINETHLTCMTQPTDNAGVALLTVTMDGAILPFSNKLRIH